MVNTELRILRVFGPTAAEVSAVLRQARADGCPGLRLLERDGEFAVCVQVSAPNRAMAEYAAQAARRIAQSLWMGYQASRDPDSLPSAINQD